MAGIASSLSFVSYSLEQFTNGMEQLTIFLDHEFKDRLAEFIRHFDQTNVHSLAEIINFNLEHPELTLPPCL
jgi:hypothetical protein